MSITLRIALIVVSVCTCSWVLRSIRKAQIKITDSVFWILFSFVLLMISLFPQIVSFFSDLTGVQSPSNFIFLVIIFVLIVKIFRMSLRISQLESKLQTLAQHMAIRQKENEEKED